MIKTFISYHHENDQWYRRELARIADVHSCFEDCSVELGEIDENMAAESVRQKIRDRYLRDTQVTILLCGRETSGRKHVEWELRSSMIDGRLNRRSGILVINLPTTTTSATSWHASLDGEKENVYRDYHGGWATVSTRGELQRRYPEMPDLIIDNLLEPKVRMSVTQWEWIVGRPECLRWLVEETAKAGRTNQYDMSRETRQHNRSR